MKDYNVIWSVEKFGRTHENDCDIMDIDIIFAYGYNLFIPNDLRNTLLNMKKGEKTYYRFPNSLDSIIITALADITQPPF